MSLGCLFPEIEPFHQEMLKVSDIHDLYVEQCGNPNGKPVIMLHGGPGTGISMTMRRLHNPQKYRIILFDQRGCGKSTPYAELRENTTWDLVDDMEKIRSHLGIDKWQVFGGSWGSTLALAYAQTHPNYVSELILRGIFMLRRFEVEWFYQEGASLIFPDRFAAYRDHIPLDERGDMIGAYYRRLTSDNKEVQLAAARLWGQWEGSAINLLPNPEQVAAFSNDDFVIAFARIESHYFQNRGFWEDDDHLLRNVDKIRHIPAIIIHGRYDMCTPFINAWQLKEKWPEAELQIIEDAGHAVNESPIAKALIQATNHFA